jgi:hypothetical protein
MLYLAVKTAISALLIVAVSEIAKRSPTFGALVASLPLVSLVAILWLWRDTGDAARIAAQSQATFWYVLPSLPMFLVIPALIRAGLGVGASLAAGVVLTVVLYLLMTAILSRFGATL